MELTYIPQCSRSMKYTPGASLPISHCTKRIWRNASDPARSWLGGWGRGGVLGKVFGALSGPVTRVAFKMAGLRKAAFLKYSTCARLTRASFSMRFLSTEQNGADRANTLTQEEETNSAIAQAKNSLDG